MSAQVSVTVLGVFEGKWCVPSVEREKLCEYVRTKADEAGLSRMGGSLANVIVECHTVRWPKVDLVRELLDDMQRVATLGKSLQSEPVTPVALRVNCNGLPTIGAIDVVTDFIQDAVGSFGMGLVALQNSSGMRTLDVWTRCLADQGMIGLALWNGGPFAAVPYGGREPFFGTNPLSYAVPGGSGVICADMATTEIPYMDLMRCLSTGQALPEGAGVDAKGSRSRRASEVVIRPDSGRLLPAGGGPKGSAIVLLVELLSGVFAGGVMGREASAEFTASEFAGVVIGLRSDLFVSREEFLGRVGYLVDGICRSEPAEGVSSVRVPGVRHGGKSRRDDWVEVSQTVYENVDDLS